VGKVAQFCNGAKKCFEASITFWFNFYLEDSPTMKKKTRRCCNVCKATGLQQLSKAKQTLVYADYFEKAFHEIAAFNKRAAISERVDLKSFTTMYGLGDEIKGRISDDVILKAEIRCYVVIAGNALEREMYELVLKLLFLAKSFTYPLGAPTGSQFSDEDDYDYYFRFGDGANARNKLFALAYEISGKAHIYRSNHGTGTIEPARLKQFLYLQQFIQDHVIDRIDYWKSNLIVFHLILEYLMFFLEIGSTARSQIRSFEHALNTLLLLPSFDYDQKKISLPSPFISKDSQKYLFDQCLWSCRETRPLEGIIRDLGTQQTPTVDNLKVSCSHLFLATLQYYEPGVEYSSCSFVSESILYCERFFCQLEFAQSIDENDAQTITSQLYKLNCQLFLDYPDLDASFSQIILTHGHDVEPVSKSSALLLSKEYFSRSIAEECNLKLKMLYLEIGKLLFRKHRSVCQPFHALFLYFLTSVVEPKEFDILSRVFFAYEKYEGSTQPQVFQQHW
jgi:hypothetical protein